MTEAVKVRDWLSELRSAGEADDRERFGELIALIAKAQPNLKSQVCQLAGEYLENGETWAADFFKNPEAQPKRVEPPKHTEAEGWGKRRGWGEEKPEGSTPQGDKVGPSASSVEEKPKPQPEEAKPDEAMSLTKLLASLGAPKREELFKAIVADKALTTTQPLAFQHSKSPVGIPASLENAITAITKLDIDCRYDIFHDRIMVKGHECGVNGDALENLENVTLKVRQAVLTRFGFDPSPCVEATLLGSGV
jgi:hypothetical protein